MCYNDYDVLTAHEIMNYPGIGESSICRIKGPDKYNLFQNCIFQRHWSRMRNGVMCEILIKLILKISN